MKKQLLAVGVVCSTLSTLLVPSQAIAASFSGLYVFGDSLSDTGNVFTATGGFPPSPYFNGRFTNGPNWIDYLGQRLGLNPTPVVQALGGVPAPQGLNFAFGGATSGGANTINPLLPGLLPSFNPFNPGQLGLALQAPLDPNGLYVVWAGANDYLPTTSAFIPETNPTTTIGNIGNIISNLFVFGARNFLVVDLPQLGQTPLGLSQGQPATTALNQLSTSHNLALQQQLGLLNTFLPGISLTTLGVGALFDQAIAGQFGFTNTTTPCLNQATFVACQNAEQFLFWDAIHPTTKAHKLIGNLAFQTLQGNPTTVPEPTAIFGLLTVGLLGVGSQLKRKTAKVALVNQRDN